MKRALLIAVVGMLTTVGPAPAVEVVATLPVYAAIAEAVGGDRVEARAIAQPDEDAHFVKPKPSLALMLRNADLFITTGLDLELWAPTLVDKSGNKKIRDGQPGFVSAAAGIPLLDVPASASRQAGDVHVYGNPHVHTSPLNAKLVAANIVAGLKRVDPQGASVYEANLDRFRRQVNDAVFGSELVELLGGDTLDRLARAGTLFAFLAEQSYEDSPLTSRLGGWLADTLPLRGQQIVAYHKNWIYFTDLFGLEVVDYVEPKPGIPPSARHVHELIRTIDERQIPLVLAATYFDSRKPEAISERTGCRAVIVPLQPGGAAARTYFDLVDLWIRQLIGPTAGG